MSQENRIDDFLFLYDLEPSELCSNFRFDSGSVWTGGSPVRELSFSLWQSMLAVCYSVHSGTKSFDGVRGEANYFATAIVACYSYLTRKVLEYSQRNWVEFELQSPATKIIAGKFAPYGQPPLEHADNLPFKDIAKLAPLIINTPPLARALHDFYSCLSENSPDCYVFAYRAVEDIRSHFDPTPDDEERKKGWNVMNTELGRKKEDYEELKGLAEKYRHNNMLGEPIDPSTTQKQVEFVRSLIRDFITLLSNAS